ncbi:ATP-binding protein [Mycobacterium sp. NPDC048908]|uniref:ATP-binding protein n=1 Tax=Mycobacterium sp. NPDC048908 TaxID=3364292 RepID=UPI003712239D
MSAAVTCHTCGGQPREGARFCDACGTPIASAQRSAEYKQVTVLFADVVRSMDIAASQGPERLREMMADLLDRSAAVVKRYGGTLSQFTGDGIMAVFGAPIMLEDHALRACMAALEIQEHVGSTLSIRIGLNSGQVIAGEIGSSVGPYTTIGEQVGMAQRMESVAPPGGVILSESTARLVEHAVDLASPELVTIKGADAAVPARRLLAAGGRHPAARTESKLVGRTWELDTVTAIMAETTRGVGGVVNIVGPAGIGKSRLVREVTTVAAAHQLPVFTTYCESHTSDVPFHVIGRLMRAISGVDGLEPHAARARLRAQTPHVGVDDVRMLEDLLGIRDQTETLPVIAPEARRRRLTALINASSTARTEPTVYVVEDAHWIDGASESMLADFIAVIPQTRSLMLITYRPEYEGALARTQGTQTIALRPLTDEQVTALSTELLGTHPSVSRVTAMVADRAAGNPFFAEETVRDLVERGVLAGHPGAYEMHGSVTSIEVPVTLQATIGARIDRLEPSAKKTLGAAAVVGMRFDADLLAALTEEHDVTPLMHAQLVDQVRFAPPVEYSFRHPLIRAVAYEAQLKADRAQLHQRLAAAIEARRSGDENAALIAEHLEAAGDLAGAFGWHMRAADWSTWRNIAAARSSWNRAKQVADRLPDDDPERMTKRIAARTKLCANAYRLGVKGTDTGFEELRRLCGAVGDQRSLAIGTCGLLMARQLEGLGHEQDSSRLASELLHLLDAIDDPTLVVALSVPPMSANMEAGRFSTVLALAQRVIDLADGDVTKGRMLTVSPLTTATSYRGLTRCLLGQRGWQDDFAQAIAAADTLEPAMRSGALWTVRLIPIANGILLPDVVALRETTEILSAAEQFGDNFVLDMARATRAITVVHQEGPLRDEGHQLLTQLAGSDTYHFSNNLRVIQVHLAREKARTGDLDGAIDLAGAALDELYGAEAAQWIAKATSVLVESLLQRGSDGDVRDACTAVDRLAAYPTESGFVLHDIWLFRLRALLAGAHGDEAAYRNYRHRYRKMAADLEFEGHMAWAEAMD